MRFSTVIILTVVWVVVSCSGAGFRSEGVKIRGGAKAAQGVEKSADTMVEPTPVPTTTWEPVAIELALPCDVESAETTTKAAGLTRLKLQSVCASSRTVSTTVPGAAKLDLVFVLDRAGITGSDSKLWSSISAVKDQALAMKAEFTRLGVSLRVGVVDFRYAVIHEWQVPLSDNIGDMSRMLGGDRNPLDEMMAIDPFADWTADENHWLYADATFWPRATKAGQLGIAEALNMFNESCAASHSRCDAEKAIVYLSDAVAFAGSSPSSPLDAGFAALAGKIREKITSGDRIHILYSADNSHGELFDGKTAHSQMASLVATTEGLKGGAMAFPLTSDTVSKDLPKLFGAKTTSVKKETRCFVTSAFLKEDESGTVVAEYAPASLAAAKAQADSGTAVFPAAVDLLKDAYTLDVRRCCIETDSVDVGSCLAEQTHRVRVAKD